MTNECKSIKKNLDHAINLIIIRCKSMTSPCQLNSLVPKVGNIGLGPWVLVPPYHDAGPVAVQVQDPTPLKVVVLIEPVLQGQIPVDTLRCRPQYQLGPRG